jgi:hypothetical protein
VDGVNRGAARVAAWGRGGARSLLVALQAFLSWAAAIDIRDVFLLSGIALLGFGLWQIWKPLPYVVIGALLIKLAVSQVPPHIPSSQELRKRHGTR